MTSWPAVAVGLGNGAPFTFVESAAGGNTLVATEAGAAAGAVEDVSKVAGEEVAGEDAGEVFDGTLA